MKKWLLWILLGGGICLFLMCLGFMLPFELAGYLAFGWVLFLRRAVDEIAVNTGGIITGVVCLIVFSIGLHLFLQWFYGAWRRSNDSDEIGLDIQPGTAPPWKWKWTSLVVSLIIAMFVAGMAMVGLTHQVAWMAASEEPMMGYSGFEAARRNNSRNNLRQIGIAAHNHADRMHTLPAGCTVDPAGRMLHGWQTAILPEMEQQALYDQIDQSKPWDHRDNRQPFKTVIDVFQNPSAPGEETSPDGLGLSHYAGNIRLLGGTRRWRFEEITDGTSHTILAGEAAGNFRPWGHPTNWRDPRLGLNQSPNGFGDHHPGITIFVYADGHVVELSDDIDPRVFRALFTPNGGEDMELDE